MAQPVLYMLKMLFHIFHFLTDTSKALMVRVGSWDPKNSYSMLQAQALIIKSSAVLLEARSN